MAQKTNQKNTEQKKKPKTKNVQKTPEAVAGLAKPSALFIASILEVTLDPPPPPSPRETKYTRFLLQQHLYEWQLGPMCDKNSFNMTLCCMIFSSERHRHNNQRWRVHKRTNL